MKWTVEFEISEVWVADGFELSQEKAQEMIENALPYAESQEVKAKIISAPTKKEIKKLQG